MAVYDTIRNFLRHPVQGTTWKGMGKKLVGTAATTGLLYGGMQGYLTVDEYLERLNRLEREINAYSRLTFAQKRRINTDRQEIGGLRAEMTDSQIAQDALRERLNENQKAYETSLAQLQQPLQAQSGTVTPPVAQPQVSQASSTPSTPTPKLGEEYKHTVVRGDTGLGTFFDLYFHGAKGKGLVKIVADYNTKNGLNVNPNTIFSEDTVIAYPLYYGEDQSNLGVVKVTAKKGQSLSRVVNQTWVELYKKFAEGNGLDVDNFSVKRTYRTESTVLFRKSDEPFDWGEALIDGEVTQEYAHKHKPEILGVISKKHIPVYEKSRAPDGLKDGSSKNKGYLGKGQTLKYVAPEDIEVVRASATSTSTPKQTSMYQGNTNGLERTIAKASYGADLPNDSFFKRFMQQTERYNREMGYHRA